MEKKRRDPMLNLFFGLLFSLNVNATTYTVENSKIAVSVKTEDGCIEVLNKTTQTVWAQEVFRTYWSLSNVTVTPGDEITGVVNMYGSCFMDFKVQLLDAENEFNFTLSSDETFSQEAWIPYPHPFIGASDCSIVVPHRTGLCVPVTDKTVWFNGTTKNQYAFFSGHSVSMNWYGVSTEDGENLMTIVMTPNDAVLGIAEGSASGRLGTLVKWRDQKREFGYDRVLRYVLQDSGGYVGMCNRYRYWAENNGLVRTLEEKKTANPNVDQIKYSAVYWPYGPYAYQMTVSNLVTIAETMRYDLGMDKMIFNQHNQWTPFSGSQLNDICDLGYLGCRYNNYNAFVLEEDAQYDPWSENPTMRPVSNAEGLLDADGNYVTVWPFVGTNGLTYYRKYWSDSFRKEWVPVDKAVEEGDGIYFDAWFIDTAFAHEWMEDYSTNHPMTHSQCRDYRVELLDEITGSESNQLNMVAGVESGIADGVPVSHWFEGKMSVPPFDFPGNGISDFGTYDSNFTFTNESLLKVSHKYQVPLWQLVFGDCVKTSPRWEHANNKAPQDFWWKKQDLFCSLYGEMQMFVFDKTWWDDDDNKEALSDSYSRVRRAIQEVRFSHMTNHVYLTTDKDVQQTMFDNGTVVTANFGTNSYTCSNGIVLDQYECDVTLDTNGRYFVENKAYCPQRIRTVDGDTQFDLPGALASGDKTVWQFEDAGGGYYFINNVEYDGHRLRSLDGAAEFDLPGPLATGNKVRWKFIPVGDGYYYLENKEYGERLKSVDGDTEFDLTNDTGDVAKWRFMKQW